ncbi:MAG: dipeptidase PepE [Bacteroidetes bacterium]|nr:dipeptidase PepE [Bacteroidota bacterium]
MRLLLLSTSRTHGTGYLEHAAPGLAWWLPEDGKRIAFVPYAAVRFDYDAYEAMVQGGLEGHEVMGVHRFDDPLAALDEADAVAIGGGNTFKLVHDLRHFGLMEAIRERVHGGRPFLGWSAGANVAAPRLCTTNDMPIIEPASFRTLGLIRPQINPHFLDAHPDGHMGETREERLQEFVLLNPDVPVIGLREGAWLEVEGERMTLGGVRSARVFEPGRDPKDMDPGADLSHLR